MADRETRITELERDVALDVAAEESIRRDAAERRAMEAQIRSEDAERAARTMSASAAAANEAADNANSNTWTTGLIALVVIIGLVIGGSVLYSGYNDKNDKLYTAATNEDRARTENRMLRDENARVASRPAGITVNVSDATRNLQRTEEAARPVPATPVPDPLPVPEMPSVPQPSVAPVVPSGSTTVESTTTTTTTTSADGN